MSEKAHFCEKPREMRNCQWLGASTNIVVSIGGIQAQFPDIHLCCKPDEEKHCDHQLTALDTFKIGGITS